MSKPACSLNINKNLKKKERKKKEQEIREPHQTSTQTREDINFLIMKQHNLGSSHATNVHCNLTQNQPLRGREGGTLHWHQKIHFSATSAL